MAESFRVCIGWDSKMPEPARVLAYSIREHASIPVQIIYLHKQHLKDCFGIDPAPDPRATTEFAFTRFASPLVLGYSGRGLFLDNDCICLADVAELADLPMEPYALRCVKHDYQPTDGSIKMAGAIQTAYPRKCWSSVFLFDAAKLTCWSRAVINEANGARLHRFSDVDDSLLGALAPEWNSLDHYEPGKTKIWHATSGGPWNHTNWQEGLASGKLPVYLHQDLWLEWYGRWVAAGSP